MLGALQGRQANHGIWVAAAQKIYRVWFFRSSDSVNSETVFFFHFESHCVGFKASFKFSVESIRRLATLMISIFIRQIVVKTTAPIVMYVRNITVIVKCQPTLV